MQVIGKSFYQNWKTKHSIEGDEINEVHYSNLEKLANQTEMLSMELFKFVCFFVVQ